MTSSTISLALAETAAEHGVRILYACESGSRAWGFESPDSDYDVRFLYARPVAEYLRLTPSRDVIEIPIHDALDISGWDVLKACRLLRRSSPHLLEWLGSPTVYVEDGPFAKGLRSIARKYFSRRACCEHYLNMAENNFRKYVLERALVIRKKYLYVLRPLSCIRWMIEKATFPPTPFAEAVEGITLPTPVREELGRLLLDKRRNEEKSSAPAIPVFNDYIVQSLD
jgi:hypothetical protein